MQEESKTELKKIAIVVDANAIIKQIPLRQTINTTIESDEEFNRMYEVFTLNEVLEEIRDEKARQFLQNLPYDLKIKSAININSDDIDTVEDFTLETGDKNTLSHVDKLVIAFGLTLSREKSEYDQVIKTPQKLEEFRPKAFKTYYEEGQEDASDSDETKPYFRADDGWTQVIPAKKDEP